jgi:TPR repeat protein
MLQNGFGVEKDLPEAVRWYRAAAEQGLASSQSCLAWMYENGVGVNKNLDEALRLYRLAAAQGDEHGIKGVERCSSELQACTAHPSTSTS